MILKIEEKGMTFRPLIADSTPWCKIGGLQIPATMALMP
jgi:hypothetical protein